MLQSPQFEKRILQEADEFSSRVRSRRSSSAGSSRPLSRRGSQSAGSQPASRRGSQSSGANPLLPGFGGLQFGMSKIAVSLIYPEGAIYSHNGKTIVLLGGVHTCRS